MDCMNRRKRAGTRTGASSHVEERRFHRRVKQTLELGALAPVEPHLERIPELQTNTDTPALRGPIALVLD